MTKKRKIIDFLHNAVTYVASSLALIILVVIFGFVFLTGKDTVSIEMIRNDYWSQNHLIAFEESSNKTFTYDQEIKDNQAFSSKYGVLFEDIVDREKQKQVIIKTVLDDSPFKTTTDLTAGPNKGQTLTVSTDDRIEKLVLVDSEGNKSSVGRIYASNAKGVADALDASSKIESLYYTTPGGGVWGSLIATLLLIAIAILIALPIGMFAAIYLNEISKKGKVADLIQHSIELLAGIPSVIFGLMGIVVLYPITTLFNVEGLSILLGALTMAVILLPVIIRSIQESLKTVPDDLRMASLSLGATQTQTIFKVVVPYARTGILSALLLSLSRIIGESAALIYTMGTFINDNPKITEGATTLSVHIWSIMSQEQPNFELASAISIVILVIVLSLNVSVKYFSQRLDRKLGH